MTAQAESVKRKLSLLQLAEETGNVAGTARIMGFHRDGSTKSARPSNRMVLPP